MALEGVGNGNAADGVAFLVSAEIVFAIIAACCSSPQTAELNAQQRAETLMKWVNIGTVTSGVFVVAASFYAPAQRKAIFTGGVLAGGAMYAFYRHAKQSGLANPAAPPTEDWQS
jgi:hypothetical protein